MLRTFRQCRTVLAVPVVVGLAGGVAASLFSTAVSAEGQKVGQRIDDATITAEVKARVLADETSRGININVDTRNGRVTLRGTAPTTAARLRAQEIAEGVEGATLVVNDLVIGDPSVNPQTATAKTRDAAKEGTAMASDSWVTTKVKTQLLADDAVKGLDVSVSTAGGVVTLSGKVPTEEMRKAAITITSAVEGVKRVDAAQLVVD